MVYVPRNLKIPNNQYCHIPSVFVCPSPRTLSSSLPILPSSELSITLYGPRTKCSSARYFLECPSKARFFLMPLKQAAHSVVHVELIVLVKHSTTSQWKKIKSPGAEEAKRNTFRTKCWLVVVLLQL